MRFALFSLLLPIVSLAVPVTRDVATIEADIATISDQVTALDNSINAFPDSGGTLTEALAIHTAAQNLESSLGTATTDVNANGPVSESDGQTILGDVQAFEPTILDALQQIATKKAAFDGLGVAGLSALALQDLQTLRNDTSSFASALISIAPADLVDQATTLATDIDNAFATAIAAYS